MTAIGNGPYPYDYAPRPSPQGSCPDCGRCPGCGERRRPWPWPRYPGSWNPFPGWNPFPYTPGVAV